MNHDMSVFAPRPDDHVARRSRLPSRPAAVPLWTALTLLFMLLLTGTSSLGALVLSVVVGGPVLLALLVVAFLASIAESPTVGVAGTVVVVVAGVVVAAAIATS